jgi:hypothetical protein
VQHRRTIKSVTLGITCMIAVVRMTLL